MPISKKNYYSDFVEEDIGTYIFPIDNRIVARISGCAMNLEICLILKQQELANIQTFPETHIDSLDVDFHGDEVIWKEGGYKSLIFAKCNIIRLLIRARVLLGREEDYPLPKRPVLEGL